jgi:hypothetical protein
MRNVRLCIDSFAPLLPKIISAKYAPPTNTSEQDVFLNPPVHHGAEDMMGGYHLHNDPQ